jgi:CDP-diacylglycerol--serine O-phosphatidyltransferase
MRKIPVWPTLATIGNLICGFSAFAAVAAGNYERAAWLIIIAMLFDAADGRLARITRTATEFGGQLDSLADVISFGGAPAFLVHYYTTTSLPAFSEKFAWTASGLFIVCAAMRLARFNVENSTDTSSHRSFKGLPSPAAAGVIASAVILLEDVGASAPAPIVGLLPIIAVVTAVLMVTRVRYPHLLSQLDLGERPFSFLLLVIFLGMLVAIAPQIGLFILFAVYAASGPIGLTIDQVLERLAAASDSEDSLF